MKFRLALLAALALPMAAHAVPTRVQSGITNGLKWTAASRVIGQTSTATIAGGGNPIYLGTADKYRGTVGLLMDYGPNEAGVPQRFVCSGSLSADRTSIISAAHCVSDGTKARPKTVTAYFYNPETPDVNETSVYAAGAPNVTTVDISQIFVNPLYTGEVIDQNDIAVLRLGGKAPAFANGYELYNAGDLTGSDFNIAGYGGRSDAGGSVGVNLGTGRLRQGDNRFDFALGDAAFGGFFTDNIFNGEKFFGTADVDFSFIADFDNGLSVNDGSCRLAVEGLGVTPSAQFCNLGRGALEATSAGGDSGGPQFIDGKLASVTSYGLSFGSDFGDTDDELNDTFGEFAGYVPTYIHADWIAGVPEPTSWALMITGFGLVGGMARRARTRTVAA